MMNENNALEEQCEDAVFQICCTRERYSTRCTNQLEKYLSLVTKKQTAHVQKSPVLNFQIPVITEEQQQLFYNFDATSERKIQHSNSKTDTRLILNRIKELKSIASQIERSKNSEIYQLLKQ